MVNLSGGFQSLMRSSMEPDIRDRLIRLTSYAATAASENTAEWMRGLVEQLNAACVALGDETRFRLRGRWTLSIEKEEP